MTFNLKTTVNSRNDKFLSSKVKITKDKLKKQYVTKESITGAPFRIRKINIDLIDHFTKNIQSNWYKAMIDATFIEVGVGYKRKLTEKMLEEKI